MKALLYQALYLSTVGANSHWQGWCTSVRDELLVPALAAVVLLLMLGEWAMRRRRRHRRRRHPG
ncbi:MAG TPA: hypothetical protein VMS92_09620 [Mycobacterium sp.]|nr:hypothetical protein [Mycobacterium sp.]